MLKAVFFDAAGTLFYLPRGPGYHYREVALRHGCALPEPVLRAAFMKAFQAMPERPETRVARSDDDREWWRQIVDQVLDRCSVGAGELDRSAYFADLYLEFAKPGVWELYPEVVPVLERLSADFELGIISNFDGRLRAILADLEIDRFFQTVVISSEVGADKPAAWIFERALAATGVSPGDAIHAGDDPIKDWRGAEAAGLRAFRLDRPRNTLADILPVVGLVK